MQFLLVNVWPFAVSASVVIVLKAIVLLRAQLFSLNSVKSKLSFQPLSHQGLGVTLHARTCAHTNTGAQQRGERATISTERGEDPIGTERILATLKALTLIIGRVMSK